MYSFLSTVTIDIVLYGLNLDPKGPFKCYIM